MILLKDGMLIDPQKNSIEKKDILIKDQKILKIQTEIPVEEGMEVFSLKGLSIAPGLIDVHVHFRDPGFTQKEDILTGAAAAAAGGFTTVVLMANTKPVVDTKEVLDQILEKGRITGIHVETCATVTKGMLGKELTDMNLLRESGAAGFTDDGIPLMDTEILKQALLVSSKLRVPISLHEEDASMIDVSGVNSGPAAQKLGFKGAPSESEASMVARDIGILKETGGILNIQHISSGLAIEEIRKAKQQGIAIYCEAAPHHFSLTEEAVETWGTLAKMNPPLRTKEDRMAVIEGLADDTIDIIATDHAPHTLQEKSWPFPQAPSGIIGLETALALGITKLVEPGYLTLPQLIKKMTINPAKLYGFERGKLYEGGNADLVIFDTEKEVKFEKFKSRSENTPFKGTRLKGKVRYTICNGNIVYQSEE